MIIFLIAFSMKYHFSIEHCLDHRHRSCLRALSGDVCRDGI